MFFYDNASYDPLLQNLIQFNYNSIQLQFNCNYITIQLHFHSVEQFRFHPQKDGQAPVAKGMDPNLFQQPKAVLLFPFRNEAHAVALSNGFGGERSVDGQEAGRGESEQPE